MSSLAGQPLHARRRGLVSCLYTRVPIHDLFAVSVGYPELKRQQLEAMIAFMSGKDVFVILPTGFGKSLIYATLPLAYDAATDKSVVIVVSPLTAIMKDQIFD